MFISIRMPLLPMPQGPLEKKDALKDDAQLSYSNSTQCFSQMLFEDNDLETFKTSSLRWGLGLVCKLVL